MWHGGPVNGVLIIMNLILIIIINASMILILIHILALILLPRLLLLYHYMLLISITENSNITTRKHAGPEKQLDQR